MSCASRRGARRTRRIRLIAVVVAASVTVVFPAAIMACGPFFPNQLLVMGDRALLTAPAASFREEMRRMKLPAAAGCKAVSGGKSNPWRQTIEVDLGEIEEALKSAKAPEARRARVLAEYRAFAEAMRHEARLWEAPYGRPPEAPPDPATLAVPVGLPGEFDDYARGALLWHRGQGAEAVAAWQKLLDRPPEERRRRTVWAAFMIGRTLLDEKDGGPDKAVAWFEKTRELAAKGFADELGLAAASLGWQALAELRSGRPAGAIRLYLAQLESGDASALESLQIAARSALRSGPEALKAAAADPLARAVVTAYMVSRGDRFEGSEEKLPWAWLEAVEAAGKDAFAGADRMAAIAYQLGNMDAAGRWLKRAPEDAPLADWLRAKLLMRAGKLDEAAKMLARASRGFPEDERWQDQVGGLDFGEGSWATFPARDLVRGELGTLQLARRQYAEALDCLARGGFRLDAGYVAERVLTVDELMKYVDASWPEPKGDVKLPERYELCRGKGDPLWLRWLLARRLVRAGRLDQARGYLPAELRPKLDELATALRSGRDAAKPQAERAEALWQAARITRRDGIELLGTECEPDWAWAGGDFELEPATRLRAGGEGRWPKLRGDMAAAKISSGSKDERARVAKSDVSPEKRFHYRYRAAALAWEAAALMPDDSDATARVLCEAGSWLQHRDPEAADRFYKALVRRCGRTALGRQADGLRWFPKLEAEKK